MAAADGDGDILVVVERAVAASPGGAPPVGDLTPREVEVLDAVAEGRTNARVAQALRLSPRTVQKHLEHVFEKLGVDNRTAAVRAARDRPRRDAAPVRPPAGSLSGAGRERARAGGRFATPGGAPPPRPRCG